MPQKNLHPPQLPRFAKAFTNSTHKTTPSHAPPPTVNLVRKLGGVVRRFGGPLVEVDAALLHAELKPYLLGFAGADEEDKLIARALVDSMIGEYDFLERPIPVTLFEGSSLVTIRDPFMALAILAARAERKRYVAQPGKSTDTVMDEVCRAGVAYAGPCQILSAAGAWERPTMVSAKEELLRDAELKAANTTIMFTPGPAEGGGGYKRGHCDETPVMTMRADSAGPGQ
ncbi:hypothetical protein DFH08DRAFT_975583 [Mycena albidolilacea]|uniref:Uncharacterized protein n=1 Tax=Mycena albidolilacea TaxID=1033008 RepID=A0AAD6Z4E0_9AGAR|nr:hypothetical protein DFH08DRAFT_975583 [Mycena albidolilacea]